MIARSSIVSSSSFDLVDEGTFEPVGDSSPPATRRCGRARRSRQWSRVRRRASRERAWAPRCRRHPGRGGLGSRPRQHRDDAEHGLRRSCATDPPWHRTSEDAPLQLRTVARIDRPESRVAVRDSGLSGPVWTLMAQTALLCRGKDSNLRRLSRRVYSPLPLAARAPLQEAAIVASGRGAVRRDRRRGRAGRVGDCAPARPRRGARAARRQEALSARQGLRRRAHRPRRPRAPVRRRARRRGRRAPLRAARRLPEALRAPQRRAARPDDETASP